jgi:hypothetical protein
MTRTQLNLFETTYDIIDQKVNDSFWAYHAGMADGDGCFIGKNKIFYSLGLIDKNIIKEISDLYGVKLCVCKKPKGHQKFYRVSLTSSNAKHFYSKVAPYLIEKRKKVRDICKKYGVQIEDVEPISLQRRLDWLCGYFDAEGNVQMRTVRNKKSNTHVFSFKLRFTSCSLLTLRYVKRILNLLFNRNGEKSILGLYKKPDKRQNRKQCYDLEIRKVSKIHLFARVFHPHIKVQRKIDKFKRICSYSNIAAQLKWTFGSINFKKNKKLRERWLKNDT